MSCQTYTNINQPCVTIPSNTGIPMFYENLEIGYTIFSNSNPNDYSIIPAGVYFIEGLSVQVNSSGVIINIKNCNDSCENVYYGGDTFINRFSLKRKHSFFDTNVFSLPNESPINYSLLGNVAYPVYFYDTIVKPKSIQTQLLGGITFPISNATQSTIDAMQNIWKNTLLNTNLIESPNYKLDCYDTINDLSGNKFSLSAIGGMIYSFIYGIASFVVESDINLNLRQEDNKLEKSFYPKQSDLNYWLQEKNVPIKIDNYYLYDKSYSKQVNGLFKYQYDVNFKGQQDCKTVLPQRVIYTSQNEEIENSNNKDNFLVNKALDYYDFSLKDGKLISIEGIEGDKVLVRQENNSSIFGAFIEINTNQETALISTGSIFKNKPIQFSNSTLGYFGSQHKAIINTPFGHITVDAKRGYVYLLANGGQGLQEISNRGLKNWFKENLPFTIDTSIKNVNIDNAFNGVGLLLCFDKRFNLFYLTKLDYKPKNEKIKYNENLGKFYLEDTGIFVSLQDKTYFENKSWTISYNFYTQSWISWHSFTPNYYIEHLNTFDTGNNKGVWKHNISNNSYQVYYGKIYPFIVESIKKGTLQNKIVQSISFYLDVIKYYNNQDFYYNQEVFFNKAIIYNRHQNSGLLELDWLGNNLSQKVKYPIKMIDRRKIELVKKENKYSFNQFENIVKKDYSHLPNWLFESNNVNKRLNNNNLDYLRTEINNDYIRYNNTKVRLINDKHSTFKFVYKGLVEQNTGNGARL